MNTPCCYCSGKPKEILFAGVSANIVLPNRPHISPHDGGHLQVVPRRHVSERSQLDPFESLETIFLSVIAGDSLRSVVGAGWINYQENGNWSVDTPTLQHLHLHVYGRTKWALKQPFGEALKFPSKESFAKMSIDRFSERQVEEIITFITQWMRSNAAEPWTVALSALDSSHN